MFVCSFTFLQTFNSHAHTLWLTAVSLVVCLLFFLLTSSNEASVNETNEHVLWWCRCRYLQVFRVCVRRRGCTVKFNHSSAAHFVCSKLKFDIFLIFLLSSRPNERRLNENLSWTRRPRESLLLRFRASLCLMGAHAAAPGDWPEPLMAMSSVIWETSTSCSL